MSSIEINGLWVEDSGTGNETVLCIHGLGGSSNFWSPILSALDGRRIIRPDLAGSGRSAPHDSPLTIAYHVDSLISVLDFLKVDRVHLVAHSMGTIIAQHLATSHPERVKSAALFGPLAEPTDAARTATRNRAELARTGPTAMQEIADAICKAATSTETKTDRPVTLALIRESIMRQSPEGYAQNCDALADAEAAQIEKLNIPVLLVTGDEDGVSTPTGTAELASRLLRQQTYLLDGCGHWTTYEKAFECTRILEDFYKS